MRTISQIYWNLQDIFIISVMNVQTLHTNFVSSYSWKPAAQLCARWKKKQYENYHEKLCERVLPPQHRSVDTEQTNDYLHYKSKSRLGTWKNVNHFNKIEHYRVICVKLRQHAACARVFNATKIALGTKSNCKYNSISEFIYLLFCARENGFVKCYTI